MRRTNHITIALSVFALVLALPACDSGSGDTGNNQNNTANTDTAGGNGSNDTSTTTRLS